MEFFLLTLISIFIFYIINDRIKDFNFLKNYKGQKHQKFSGLRNIPLSGGIFLTFSSMIYFYSLNYILSLFILLIFIVGFISDTNLLSSPKLRFLIQSVLIIFFVLLLDIKIHQTNLIFLDVLLKNIYFKYFFSIFCLLILINGSNFIDGLNGLMLGYFSLIIFLIYHLDLFNHLEIDKTLLINFMIILVFLFILNINNKLFMGDSGSYVLSLICGYFLIEIHQLNAVISPYFIVLLLWYPCFENLFSILRKFILKRSPIKADDNHFHQLVFFYIRKKIGLKKLNPNNISSYLIILYNLIIFIIGSNDPSNTQLQIILIIFNILVYLVIYFKLFIFKYNTRFKSLR
jgi:UDP-N-acetylmuramyl pentapeptide phosphotransferase/UDP-N-acetylglucosamine-1-phosphate transferase